VTALRLRFGSRRPAAAVSILAVVALVASLAIPAAVAAHARLRTASPGQGATLGAAPSKVELTFSEKPDAGLTSIKVLDAGGRDHVDGPVTASGDPALSVSVPLGELPDGAYTVSWRTVSAVDGHISAGSYVFGVGQAPPSAPPDNPSGGASESGSPPAIAARVILYLGLLLLIGAAWVALAVVRRPSADLPVVAGAGWLLTAVGTVAVIAVQWAEVGAPIETLLSTSVGVAAIARGISLLLVGLAVAILAVRQRMPGDATAWAGVGVTAAGALVVDVATGHAAAGTAWYAQVAAQAAHGLAAAAWLGGLASLLVVLRTTPADERLSTAKRFSSWAAIALVIVALSGALRALAEVATVENLIGTDYGRAVVAKTALFIALLGLGAMNRFVILRTAARVGTYLRRVASAELVIAAAVIALTGWLVNLSPPASAGGPVAPVERPAVAMGHDFGTTMRVRLVVTPGAAGPNTFDVAVNDYDTGLAAEATSVELRFEIASVDGVEPSTLQLDPVAPGRFSAPGPALSIDGIWSVIATVTVPGSAVEVPLVLATTVAAQPFETIVSEGLPTIYNVSLDRLGSAQVYLDPGGAGQNELHVTFFDPGGSEEGRIESATMAIFPTGGEGEIVTARLLEPGHFVATVDVDAGSLGVDVIAPMSRAVAGQPPIHLHVTLEVTP
jgi:copper transport protein